MLTHEQINGFLTTPYRIDFDADDTSTVLRIWRMDDETQESVGMLAVPMARPLTVSTKLDLVEYMTARNNRDMGRISADELAAGTARIARVIAGIQPDETKDETIGLLAYDVAESLDPAGPSDALIEAATDGLLSLPAVVLDGLCRLAEERLYADDDGDGDGVRALAYDVVDLTTDPTPNMVAAVYAAIMAMPVATRNVITAALYAAINMED